MCNGRAVAYACSSRCHLFLVKWTVAVHQWQLGHKRKPRRSYIRCLDNITFCRLGRRHVHHCGFGLIILRQSWLCITRAFGRCMLHDAKYRPFILVAQVFQQVVSIVSCLLFHVSLSCHSFEHQSHTNKLQFRHYCCLHTLVFQDWPVCSRSLASLRCCSSRNVLLLVALLTSLFFRARVTSFHNLIQKESKVKSTFSG